MCSVNQSILLVIVCGKYAQIMTQYIQQRANEDRDFMKRGFGLAKHTLKLPQNLTCIKRLIIHTKKQHLRYLFPLSFSNSTQQAESKLFTFRFAPLYYYRIVCISCRMWKIVVWNSSSHAHECQKENVFLCVYVLYGYLWQNREEWRRQ